MLTFSSISVPLILTGESSPRAIIFTIELTKGQVLSPVFMNVDIIVGLVYEHMNVEPVVVQKHEEKATLLVFSEAKKLKKKYDVIPCNALRHGWVTG